MQFMHHQTSVQASPMASSKVNSFNESEAEDDGFYDELRRQVLLLTAEDDDDVREDVYENKIISRMGARKQGPLYGPCGVRQPLCCYDWPGIEEDCAATPAWMLSLWRGGNGTGVFIPQIVQSRRKNRSRRKTERGRTHKRVERMN